MRARRPAAAGAAHAHRAAQLRSLIERYGPVRAAPWPAQLARIEAGVPVVVRGWQIRYQPANGDFCLGPNGDVTRVSRIYHLDAVGRRIVTYRRPDGSVVF